MSNRGRGRGRATIGPSLGRGDGRGRGGGRRAGGEPSQQAPPPQPRHQAVPTPSPHSVPSLGSEIQQKLTLHPAGPSQPPARAVQQPPAPPFRAVQPPAQPVVAPPSSSKAIRPPLRPGFGKVGTKCLVRANHFLVQVEDKDLHHYDVSISPEVASKKVCRLILRKLGDLYSESHLGNRQLAYDGKKSAYTAGPLPFVSKEFVVKLVDNESSAQTRRDREFKVAIKFAAKADLHHLQQFLQGRQLDVPQETIQALDVVLRAAPSTKFETVGRSFFYPSFGAGELANGLQYWKGFYQSLRPTQMGLSLNIDMSARAFYEPILVSEFVSRYFCRDLTRPLSDQDRVKVKRALKGVRVEFSHREYVRRYKISGLSTQAISQLRFPLDDTGTNISVVDYFRQKYDIALRYTFLPALQAGNDEKPIYLPMETCMIVDGQRYTKKLNEKQVTALLRATCQRPNQRETTIKRMVENNNYNNDKLNTEFGIQMRTDLTTIDARVLPAPQLKYHDSGRETRVNPRVGQWNMINKKMVNAGTVEYWTCINFSNKTSLEMVNQFCESLASMCCSKGMDFLPPFLPIQSAHPGGVERALLDIHNKSNAKLSSMGFGGKQLQLLIIILPDVTGSYGRIKRVCETELGIVSQCCQPRHVSRNSNQYHENVALKINVKVGGRNTVLLNAVEKRYAPLTDRPTIVFGADVTHPQAGEDSSPSIAAVVASVDWPEVTKYRGLVSAQSHRNEIIENLYSTYQDPLRGTVHSGMIREHLIAFRKSTGQKPQRIIFYRDGVSEGQFNQVLLYEMDAIRKACVSLEENYLPRVTFVVVQKRHHTRLFPVDHNDRNSTDKSGNILPGTVVETKICHPTEFDFYLCSHAGIQGTSRPAHYHVLFDENGFSADELQMLTNNLCYTYARCTRSVSIVPPAYYAHLAAFRARYYIEGDASETESTSGGRATRERNAEVRSLPAIKENVKEVMFYC